ncbi:GNAT family acetyltransferase [Neokomagataea tanensis]|uniref:GNAT family acetyltransferase n=2 Tax=Neokomagataea TaxID=1223423 RepID=A0A4Y6V8X3_9PROT|nr:GNAT family acetyltransferase [Neokomagataea tanensis]QDH25804.1 GNAT family acetyltransferase [Neokomagataea tanensis]
MLSIRAALAIDEDEVVALWRQTGLTVPYNDPYKDFRFAQQGQSSTVLVGHGAKGPLLASVMVGHDGHRGWLYYVAVASNQQRLGIGRCMVKAAEEWLKGRGIEKMQLMVRETNEQAVAFYEKLGFDVTPRTVMAKWIRNTEKE